ncbi:copper homeostasis protein CutC [Paraliobacillus quinghaiensis]|uniref:PF03932 family protein CutC n=1 Tax=Paraliobacillus quinghaiensis TaxID=470815 RepID=A0A917TNI7_9BACI|nr:copper homeostasis protein CutC [Paraliobacillus quinghaiensis]GGM30557.1 copper homeostasis protein CutC [Paraliobacillus quinghaiensis]
MIVEVIATTVEDAIVCELNGADRIELISSIKEGGLTPSYGLIKQVVEQVEIPVHVMVRPHSYSFCYSKQDIKIMLEDIKQIRKLGASGIVVGALTKEHQIDIATVDRLLSEVGELNVTFHRAFDEVLDQEVELTKLFRFSQINRVLTSGGKPNVIEGAAQLQKLVQLTNDKQLTILAGGGVTHKNVDSLIAKTGIKEVHVGSGARFSSQAQNPIDPNLLMQF